MKWLYKGLEVDSLPDGTYGFIYLIEYEDDYKYIGKKQCVSFETLPALKSMKLRLGAVRLARNINGTRKYFDVITKQSNWKSYVGSCKDDKAKNLKIIRKSILQLSTDKINLTFNEVEWLIKFDVLRDDMFLNSNISGKFFKGRIV